MLISELLAQLAARDVTLEVDGGTLFVKPAGVLSNDERDAVRARKPALVAIVRLWSAANERTTQGQNGALILCDRELSQLWRAALEAAPGDVVTISGAVFPKTVTVRGEDYPARFDAGRAFDESPAPEMRAAA